MKRSMLNITLPSQKYRAIAKNSQLFQFNDKHYYDLQLMLKLSKDWIVQGQKNVREFRALNVIENAEYWRKNKKG